MGSERVKVMSCYLQIRHEFGVSTALVLVFHVKQTTIHKFRYSFLENMRKILIN